MQKKKKNKNEFRNDIIASIRKSIEKKNYAIDANASEESKTETI